MKKIFAAAARKAGKNLLPLWELLRSPWRYHHLLFEFVNRDIRGRFAGTFAGTLWTVINPIATMLAYFFVFSVVIKMRVTVEEVGTNNFLIFFLSGFFPWLMFSESLIKAVNSLVVQSGLITRMVFPVELLPLSALLSSFILNGAGFLLFLLYLAFAGYGHPSWVFLPLLVVMEMLFALGLSWLLAALCVFIRDIAEVLNIVIMLWFFGTPVIYPGSMVPASLRPLFDLNPMFFFIRGYRELLLFHRLDPWLVLELLFFSLFVCLLGGWFFARLKPSFGDVL